MNACALSYSSFRMIHLYKKNDTIGARAVVFYHYKAFADAY